MLEAPIKILPNTKAANAWNEYLAAGLDKDLSSFHLCLVLQALHTSGLAKRLNDMRDQKIDDVIKGYDQHTARHMINYLTIRELIIVNNDKVRLTEYGQRALSDISLAQIGFYVEAYAPVLFNMSKLLTNEKTYGTDVERNGQALGAHCATLFEYFHTEIILEILEKTKATSLLDLGCGGGMMLIDSCKHKTSLSGYGLDIAPGAIEYAKNFAKKEGLADRAKFAVGDAFDPATWPLEYQNVDAISAVGALHEHFRDGEQAVINMLNIFADLIKRKNAKCFILGEPELYYDRYENDPDLYLIHIFTAQGFPRRRELWMKIIEKSNLYCEQVYTRSGIGPRFCFYLLKLKQ